MALSLQVPTDGSPGHYDVLSGAMRIGEIYKRAVTHRESPEWTWVLNSVPDGPDGMAVTGSAESRDGAEAALRESWEQWLAWAGLSDASGAAALIPPHKTKLGTANDYNES
jgi:hypothetical protein